MLHSVLEHVGLSNIIREVSTLHTFITLSRFRLLVVFRYCQLSNQHIMQTDHAVPERTFNNCPLLCTISHMPLGAITVQIGLSILLPCTASRILNLYIRIKRNRIGYLSPALKNTELIAKDMSAGRIL